MLIVNDILSNTSDKKLSEGVIEYYNGVCLNLPKVQKITQSRKTAIKKRVKDYGKEKLKLAIDLTARSDFFKWK